MKTLHDLEARLSAALDRIAYQATQVAQTPAEGDGALEDARAQLDAERLLTAQLNEHLRVQKAKSAQDREAATAVEGRQKMQIETLDQMVQQLRAVNAQLRETNEALRGALAANVSDPAQVNQALLSELEALRALREVDANEAEVLLSELRPLLEGDDNARD